MSAHFPHIHVEEGDTLISAVLIVRRANGSFYAAEAVTPIGRDYAQIARIDSYRSYLESVELDALFESEEDADRG